MACVRLREVQFAIRWAKAFLEFGAFLGFGIRIVRFGSLFADISEDAR